MNDSFMNGDSDGADIGEINPSISWLQYVLGIVSSEIYSQQQTASMW